MSAVKDEVQTMINSLPNDCTMEDIQYHLYVIEKIQNGMDDIDQDRTISHEEAKEKMAKWL